MPLVPEVPVALEAAHRRDAQPRNQVRIFAVGLFDAAPARLARHIHHRRQRMMRAAQARFESRHREQRLHQRGIEGCAQRNGLRKAGSIRRRVAVQALLVEDHRNAQAAVLEEELLDGVGQLGHAASVLAAAGIARPADLSQSAAVAKRLLRLLEIEVALRIHQRLGLRLPDAQHLRGLFLQRHPREQVLDAPGGGQTGVFISGSGFAGGSRRLRTSCFFMRSIPRGFCLRQCAAIESEEKAQLVPRPHDLVIAGM